MIVIYGKDMIAHIFRYYINSSVVVIAHFWTIFVNEHFFI